MNLSLDRGEVVMALVKIGLIIVFLIAFTAMGIGTVSAVACREPGEWTLL